MPFDLVPEPPSDIRPTLDRLLEEELAHEQAPSAWWLVGIQEAIGDGEIEAP